MASSQPITNDEIKSVEDYIDFTGGINLQEMNPDALMERIQKIKNKSWFMFEHENLSKKEFMEIVAAMKEDKIENFMIFQSRPRTAIILHGCPGLGIQKCKCKSYSKLCPPMHRKGKQNMNILTAYNNRELFREIFQVFIEMRNPSNRRDLKVLRLSEYYTIENMKAAYHRLAKISTRVLSIPCGKKVEEMISSGAIGFNVSNIEFNQSKTEEKYAEADINDILSGALLNAKEKEELSKPRDGIVQSLLTMFDYYMPIPTANIVHHPHYKASPFAHLYQDNKKFIAATKLFELKWSNYSVLEYLEIMSDRNPSSMMLRSDGYTIKYMEIDESVEFIKKWMVFQFGEWPNFTRTVWNWLIRSDFKKGE